MTTNTSLRDWVEQTAKLTQPARIHWCNGSDLERDALVRLMLGTGDLIELNQATFPNCYLHRSNPSDVARVEHLTFICTPQKEDAGPGCRSPPDCALPGGRFFLVRTFRHAAFMSQRSAAGVGRL